MGVHTAAHYIVNVPRPLFPRLLAELEWCIVFVCGAGSHTRIHFTACMWVLGSCPYRCRRGCPHLILCGFQPLPCMLCCSVVLVSSRAGLLNKLQSPSLVEQFLSPNLTIVGAHSYSTRAGDWEYLLSRREFG